MTGPAMTKWRLVLVILVAGLLADHGTKYLAVSRLTTALDHGPAATAGLGTRLQAFYALKNLEAYATEPYVVWAPMWRMRYAENPYAAFSLFSGLPVAYRTLFFGVITLLATVFIVGYLRKVERGQRLTQVTLALILTGAWANFLDRLPHGYVVDFIDWHWWRRPDLYWPTFNIADSLIVVGVLMLMVKSSGGPNKQSGSSA